jgi:hypothetical protein
MGYHIDIIGKKQNHPNNGKALPLIRILLRLCLVVGPTNIHHHKLLTIIIQLGKHNSHP